MAAVRSLQRLDPQSLVQVLGRRLPVSGRHGKVASLTMRASDIRAGDLIALSRWRGMYVLMMSPEE